MRHVRILSSGRPAGAQLETLLQVVALIQAVLGIPTAIFTVISDATDLLVQLSGVFGIDIPSKHSELP